MGAVFKAEHRLMERTVALKVISKSLVEKLAAVERFRREVKAAAKLSHPNIVTAYDAEQAGDAHFLVMEHVEGVSLAQLVEKRGPLPVVQACHFVRQAALGLQHAHEAGMVHRDLKPQNLMVTPKGMVKILDFGLARFVSEASPAAGLTQESAVLGTPDYMAPEQATEASKADIRADLYSLGCTLYFLLAGKPPFPGDSVMAKLLAHAQEQPRSVTELRKDVPAGLVQVLKRLLAKDPAQRYQTPREVAQALTPFVQPAGPGQPAEAAGTLPRGGRGLRRWLVVAVALGMLLGAVALLGPMIFRIETDKGQLVIKTEDPDIQVIVKQGGRQVTILDSKANKQIELTAGEYEVAIAPGKDGLRLSTDRFTLKRGEQRVVEVWREPALPEFRVLEGHTERVQCVAFSPDGQRVLSASHDKTARMWDVKGGKQVQRFAHPAAVRLAQFSPDGRRVVTAADAIRLWDADSGKELQKFALPPGAISSLAVSPDFARLAVGGPDGKLRLWDLERGQEVQTFVGHKARINTIVFAPDGRRIVSGSGGPDQFDWAIRVWDTATGKELQRLVGHKNDVHCIALSPDGRWVLSVGDDGTARLWDAAKGTEMGRFRGHLDAGYCTAFSSDSRRALTSGRGKLVHLWDVTTTRELHTMVGHTEPVYSVAISPDGRLAVSASGDKTVRLCRLPSQ
jgi:WD40 repeat protein